MKLLPAILCLAIIALVTPACSTAPKKQEMSCCASKGGSCDAPAKKHKH